MGDVIKPWHEAPPCPKCKGPIAPFEARGNHGPPQGDGSHLLCVACGHDWRETDGRTIAWAWWSQGAYAGCVAAGGRP